MRALPSGARIARASASAAVPAFFPDLLLDSDQTISATIATSAITEKIIIAPGESDCANAGPKSAPAIAAAKITVTQNAFLLISRSCSGGSKFSRRLVHQMQHAIVRSEEHTSELQSLMRISYAVLCMTKKSTYSTNST